MELWLATGNKGKVDEYKLALKSIPDLTLHTLAELKSYTPRPEDGATFLDNARIKARSLKSVKPNDWILAEDSGLEVEGLGNLPGVHSARYAGPHARDSENIAKLLKMMQIRNINPRTARFKCVTVVLTPAGEEWVFEGFMDGVISQKPTGMLGFGYDPVFVPTGQTQSLAELGPGYKIQNSHRAEALKLFLKKLAESSNSATV